MGLSLTEYAAQHHTAQPAAEQREMREQAEAIREKNQNKEEAAWLKEVILQQLQQGVDPQPILYEALQCIGLLSGDIAWAAAGRGCMDSIYADLEQQSLLLNEAEQAKQRLDAIKREYTGKLRQQIKREMKGYQQVEQALIDTLDALNSIDPDQLPDNNGK